MDRRDVLKGVAALPLLGAASKLEVFGKGTAVAPRLNVIIEGPFGLNVNPTGIEAWTPAWPDHQYLVNGQGLTSNEKLDLPNSHVIVNPGKPSYDSEFQRFKIDGAQSPSAHQLLITLPMPAEVHVGCWRTIQTDRQKKKERMPLSFVLVYDLDPGRAAEPLSISLMGANTGMEFHPYASNSSGFLNLHIETGVLKNASNHGQAVFEELVRTARPGAIKVLDFSVGSGPGDFGQNNIPGVPKKTFTIPAKGTVRIASTQLDCTAGGVPGCNYPPCT